MSLRACWVNFEYVLQREIVFELHMVSAQRQTMYYYKSISNIFQFCCLMFIQNQILEQLLFLSPCRSCSDMRTALFRYYRHQDHGFNGEFVRYLVMIKLPPNIPSLTVYGPGDRHGTNLSDWINWMSPSIRVVSRVARQERACCVPRYAEQIRQGVQSNLPA